MEQITKTLPASAWKGITIKECGEPLVEVPEMPKLKLGLLKKEYVTSFLVREGIRAKLIRVTESLPDNMCLVLIEGWRSMEH